MSEEEGRTEPLWLRQMKADREAQRKKREPLAERIDAYVKDVVDKAPPLSPEQRDQLAMLLRGGKGA